MLPLTPPEPCVEVALYFQDVDGDSYGGLGTGALRCVGANPGWASRAGDCDDHAAAVNPAVLESCNGVDDDCDLSVDEGPAVGATAWYPDRDHDTYGSPFGRTVGCAAPRGYVARGGDCSDRIPAVHPRAVERCNGLDDDCSGTVDGPDAVDVVAWYPDADGDGFGDPTGAVFACAAEPGMVADAGDCDDASADVNPVAVERCDGVDEDCDGLIDDDATDAITVYYDVDGDGYAGVGLSASVCEALDGWYPVADDCDDAVVSAFPGAPETCNGVDDDCDGAVDPDGSAGAPVWYADADGDGAGDAASAVVTCTAPDGYVALAGDCDDADAAWAAVCPPAFPYSLAWGDLHAHTGLSHDGCEDPLNHCLPEGGGLPGHHLFEHAAASGLAFVAITDHAEWERYQRPDDGIDLDIWDEAQAIVQAADGGAVIPLLGYEYTAGGGHRTVIFDSTEVCRDYVKATTTSGEAAKDDLALEVYVPRVSSGYTTPSAFEAGMNAAAATSECEGVRWQSWFHHPAYQPPASVSWAASANRIASDTVVEISSEHGSSECSNLAVDGCEFRVDAAFYRTNGSVQTALTRSYRLGFVGGSDNHEGYADQWADPEGGYVGELADTDGDGLGDTPRVQPSAGSLTAVYHDAALTRTGVFDAIAARNTLAATWPAEGLTLYAFDDAANVILPGDDVASGPLHLVVTLEDPRVDSWEAELVDPVTGSASPVASLSLARGDVRYVRIRAWVGGTEQRIWASPFFGI